MPISSISNKTNINILDYDYFLPEELIAQYPANPRDSCKLMVVNNNSINHHIFRDITKFFKKGDILVLNNTKVLHTKIIGKKDTGSVAEIVILKKLSEKKTKNVKLNGEVFEAKIKTRNPNIGTKILIEKSVCEIIGKKNIDTFIIRISNTEVLNNAIMPSPPYIKHVLSDKEYQTVYSKSEKNYKKILNGSLASPTAGLHFTKYLLAKIKSLGVKIVYITLHVSYGTFKNIDDINTYVMDPEKYIITKDSAKIINSRSKNSRLIVCGTTTLKTLETCSDDKGKIIPGSGGSKLFIYPPYKFKSNTDILITNFHLPKSTLLLLTTAFGGKDRILDAYRQAVKNKYRFFSLGDSMMIYKNSK
jgi:S-adenosylmethionine:tRNA ribosyltransferase-isomerase